MVSDTNNLTSSENKENSNCEEVLVKCEIQSDQDKKESPYNLFQYIVLFFLVTSSVSLLGLWYFTDAINFNSNLERISLILFILVGIASIPAAYFDHNLRKYKFDEIKKNEKSPSFFCWVLTFIGFGLLITPILIRFFNGYEGINFFNLCMFVASGGFLITASLSSFLVSNERSELDAFKILERKHFILISSFLGFWATINTYSDLNSLFIVDQGYLSFTIVVGVGLWFFLLLGCCLSALTIIGMAWLPAKFKGNEHSWIKRPVFYYWILNFIISFLIIFYLGLYMSDKKIRLEVLSEVAFEVDFNENFDCSNFKKAKDKRIIFLGPNGSHIYGVNKSELDKFLKTNDSTITYDFKGACNPLQ